MSPVFLAAVTNYAADLSDVVLRGMRELGVDVAGKRVLLKPNLVEYEPGVRHQHQSVGHCRRGNRDAPGRRSRSRCRRGRPAISATSSISLTATGLSDHLREHRIRFVDLNTDDVEWRELASNFTGIGRMALPASVLNADLVVSMPKLKTHHWAGMTCSMKNLFGVVPGAVYGWPKNLLHQHGIDDSIVDLVATVRPGLTIVDGIVGMEGDGPIMGTPRGFGVLAMSTRSGRGRRDVRPRPWLRGGEASLSRDRGPVPREPRRAAHRSARRSARPICDSRGRARSLSRMAGWLMKNATVRAADWPGPDFSSCQGQTSRPEEASLRSARFALIRCKSLEFKAVRRHFALGCSVGTAAAISEVRAIASLKRSK